MLAPLERLVVNFFASESSLAVPDEATMRRELAVFFRAKIPNGWRLFVERPVSSFGPTQAPLAKKKIDIAVVDTQNDRVVAYFPSVGDTFAMHNDVRFPILDRSRIKCDTAIGVPTKCHASRA